MEKRNNYLGFINWLDNNIFITALRQGLIKNIPIIMIGAFALLFKSFPIPAYQEFLNTCWNGNFNNILEWIFHVTIWLMPLYLSITVSLSYAGEMDPKNQNYYPISAVICNLIIAGNFQTSQIIEMFQVSNLFNVLVMTLISCYLLKNLFEVKERSNKKKYQVGVDINLQKSISNIFPIIGVALMVILFRIVMLAILGDVEIQKSGTYFGRWLFGKLGNGFFGSIAYIFFVNFTWLFGIHGSNILSDVSLEFFENGVAINQCLIACGNPPTEIFSKSFFDVFILMGGSGATICLFLALIIASKQRNNKNIVKLSFFPCIFNINEMLIFGVPVVFNPIMIIPFVCVPIILLCTSTMAVYLGLIPIVSETVNWTTPVILSGIVATKSWAGGLLQLFNIGIGTLIYIPFVRLTETNQIEILKNNIERLNKKVIEGEVQGTVPKLFEGRMKVIETAKMLSNDLQYAIRMGEINLHYQPQVDSDGNLMGAEALLRWKHPVVGFVYPPLVIELAKQDEYLDELGLIIIEKACQGIAEIAKKTEDSLKISVNISPIQLNNDKFVYEVACLINKYEFGNCKMAFELTEQISLAATPIIIERINQLRNLGILIIMDDFGMGHSSMMYLQNNEFDYIKLDGSLIRSLLENKKSENIIISIQQFSKRIGCNLIAEYVETVEQRDRLKQLGCFIYQGYYYSKAIPMDEFLAYIKKYFT